MSLQAWKRVASVLGLALSLIWRPDAARADNLFSRQWWLNESHMPVQVNDLLREPGGALWIATDAGIYRFTGTAFVPVRDTGGAATCLYYTGSGMLAGYRNGRISRIVADSAVTIPVPGGGPDAAITSFAAFGDMILFSTLGSGIWALHGRAVGKFGTAQGLSDDYVYGLQIVGPGSMLAATDRGLARITIAGVKPQTGLVIRDGIVQSLRPVPGRAGRVLAGTNEGHWYDLQFWNSGRWTMLSHDSLPAPVLDFAVQNGAALVLCENAAVYTYTGFIRGRAVPRDSFKLSQDGSRLLADAAGTLWHGGNTGLTAVSSGFLTRMQPAPGYHLGSVAAMAVAGETVWYGQSDSLVGIGPGGTLRRYRMPAQITSLAADTSGIWIGTLGSGLLHMNASGSLTLPDGAKAFSREHVLSITLFRNRLWMATLSGLDEFEVAGAGALRELRHHSKHRGLGADYIYQCVPDRQGRMWIATDGAGICCYAGGTYRRWTDGQDGFRGRTVYSITEDAGGQIWAATLEHGICRFDGRRWTSIGRGEGLQSLNVSGLATLGDGQVLVVHDGGMDLWQPAEATFRHIGRRQGMSIDSSSRMLNCFARTPDGAVLTPYEDGFLRFLPHPGETAARPGIRLIQAVASGQSGNLIRHVFEPEETSLSFRFEGANPLNAERLYYRYRLAGFMRDWIVTRDESANFARLPAGAYDFEVQAAYNAAFGRPASLRFGFRIELPLWQRWWAITLAAGLLILAALLVIRYRERNIRRIEQLQHARVQMEYEHLKSQINPHFLFNSLNILGTLINRDPARAAEYTYALSDLYRNTLHYRDRELIPLEEEWEILTQYLVVQKTRFGEALQLEWQIPDELFKTARIVPLALQLMVENAIKHNIVSASSPLTISILAGGGRLLISNPVRPKRNPEKGTGIGLANIRSRYGLHRQDIRFGIADDIFTVELPLL